MSKVQIETSGRDKYDTSSCSYFVFRFRNFLAYIRAKSGKLKQLPLFLVLFATLLPIFCIAGYRSIVEFRERNEMALSHIEKIALSVTVIVEEELECIVDLGSTLVGTTALQKVIAKGLWEDASDFVKEGLSKSSHRVDVVSLYDPQGILKATTSGDASEIGKNFASQDYYLGVSKNWEPYVSGVLKKANEKYDIVSVAIPVRSSAKRILGVLVLEVRLDTVSEWVSDTDIGRSGLIYVVDQSGQIVIHPHFSLKNYIVDYSDSPAVQKILRGESGVEVLTDPKEKEKQLTAYASVSPYGWGVVVLQPVSVAFADRDRAIWAGSVIWGLIVALTGFFVYRILKSKAMIKVQSEREQRLIDSLGDGVVATDKKWNITLWNKAASVITGWTKEEVFGKPVHPVLKIIRERDRKEVLPLEYAFVEKKASSLEENILLVKKDGSEIPVGDSAAPILNEGELPEGAIIIFRDLTQEREASHLRSDFAYATHQLRTPVTEALWNLDLAIEENDPVKKKDDIEIVHQSLESVKKLTEDLVAVSEFDQGAVSVKKAMTKIIDILAEVQKKIEPKARERKVAVFVAPVSPVAAINTDPKFLKRILYEIIENAVSYSRQGTEVVVAVSFHEKEVVIEIVDTGMGITEEQQPLIFTKFFRGSNSGSKGAGSGLGLFLAKECAKLLGGKIWFTSEEGKGTTFYVSLPIE